MVVLVTAQAQLWVQSYLFLAICVLIVRTGETNQFDCAADEGASSSTVLYELPVLSPSSFVDDPQSGERFQAWIERGGPRLHPASTR